MPIRRIRRIHLLAVPAMLIVAGLILEISYRRSFDRQLGELSTGIERAHEPEVTCGLIFYRFDQPTQSAGISLLEDLSALVLYKARRWSPIRSRLLKEGAMGGMAAYAWAAFTLKEERFGTRVPVDTHPFVWSPRSWSFERTLVTTCDKPDCPAYSEDTACNR